MIKYKINVIASLADEGWNTTRIARERPISQAAMQQIRNGEPVGIHTLNKLCELLDLQPGNIIRYVPDDNS